MYSEGIDLIDIISDRGSWITTSKKVSRGWNIKYGIRIGRLVKTDRYERLSGDINGKKNWNIKVMNVME